MEEAPTPSDRCLESRPSASASAAVACTMDDSSECKPSALSDSHSQPSEEQEQRFQALQRIGKDAKQYWTSLPSQWRVEKSFILHALHKSPTLPPKSDFERPLPQSLRFDRDVVLAFCQRSDFEDLYKNRHLFVPGNLKNDKEVMIAYCQRIPRSLQECSEELCDDPEVVIAAISMGGLELQYASLRLQEDAGMLQLACRSDSRALECCPPGSTRNALTSNKVFMRDVVLANMGGGPLLKLAPLDLQKDPELLLKALKTGLRMRHVPDPFRDDTPFLQRALSINPALYLQLLPPKQAEICLARQAIISADSTPEIHAKALGYWPSLKRERQVVLALCERGDPKSLPELLSLSSSEIFTNDLEIMEAAVRRDCNLFAVASSRLQLLPSLILVSITPTSALNRLKSISSALVRQYPEISIRVVRQSVPRNLRYLPGQIPDEVWAASRELCLTWLQRGGKVLQAFQPLLVVDPPFTETDFELPLAIAKGNWLEFHKVGNALLLSKDFLLRALALDGRLFRFVPPSLRHDIDIQVMAVANHHNNIQAGTGRPNTASALKTTLAGRVDIPRLSVHIQERLTLHQTFCQDFLRGIAIARPHQPPQLRSQLPMLDRGVETSQAFKRLIAEFLAVPLGSQLSLLRRAQANLEEPILSNTISNAAAGSEAAPSVFLREEALFDDDLMMDRVAVHGFRGHFLRNHRPHRPLQQAAFVPPGVMGHFRQGIRQQLALDQNQAERVQRLVALRPQLQPGEQIHREAQGIEIPQIPQPPAAAAIAPRREGEAGFVHLAYLAQRRLLEQEEEDDPDIMIDEVEHFFDEMNYRFNEFFDR